MDRRVFHGNINPTLVAQALMAEFNQGNLQTQLVGDQANLTVQIASSQYARSGGKTALTVNVQQITDGVMVQVGEQEWLGVAADLGATVLATLINPMNLIGRLGSIASDVSSLQLTDHIWDVIGKVVNAAGATKQISERLTRLACSYCGAANPVGESTCLACGAPLGNVQPKACGKCGYVLVHDEKFCPNCGQPV
ncbi:MAG TPA: zinc ribbon domain-containing protein [Anaerolineales bacterium]|nr:zinc ribbon domain-containing protein [Anaerolineales bacterium]